MLGIFFNISTVFKNYTSLTTHLDTKFELTINGRTSINPQIKQSIFSARRIVGYVFRFFIISEGKMYTQKKKDIGRVCRNWSWNGNTFSLIGWFVDWLNVFSTNYVSNNDNVNSLANSIDIWRTMSAIHRAYCKYLRWKYLFCW